MIAAAPKMRALIQDLITLVANNAATPDVLRGLARRAATLELELRDLHGDEAAKMRKPSSPPADAPPARAPQVTPSPTPQDLRASSLSERMAALERELNLSPRTPAFTPTPSKDATPSPRVAQDLRAPSLSERMVALERELNLRPRTPTSTPAPPRADPAPSRDPLQDAAPTNLMRRRPK